MVKLRRHHNNDGRAQIKRGTTIKRAEKIAQQLGVPTRKGELKHVSLSTV